MRQPVLSVPFGEKPLQFIAARAPDRVTNAEIKSLAGVRPASSCWLKAVSRAFSAVANGNSGSRFGDLIDYYHMLCADMAAP